ncbi:UNVERIFIED_CONTAM: Transposon Ty1-BL Gag-Pol polyprotein [Sesamum indicum]
MDVVTAYFYGSMSIDISMRIPKGLKMPKALKSKPRHMYSIKLKRSLYGLKQSGCTWYNRLSEYLIKKGFYHNQISLFIHKEDRVRIVIIVVYVDDFEYHWISREIRRAIDYLKSKFEMKNFGIQSSSQSLLPAMDSQCSRVEDSQCNRVEDQVVAAAGVAVNLLDNG